MIQDKNNRRNSTLKILVKQKLVTVKLGNV